MIPPHLVKSTDGLSDKELKEGILWEQSINAQYANSKLNSRTFSAWSNFITYGVVGIGALAFYFFKGPEEPLILIIVNVLIFFAMIYELVKIRKTKNYLNTLKYQISHEGIFLHWKELIHEKTTFVPFSDIQNIKYNSYSNSKLSTIFFYLKSEYDYPEISTEDGERRHVMTFEYIEKGPFVFELLNILKNRNPSEINVAQLKLKVLKRNEEIR